MGFGMQRQIRGSLSLKVSINYPSGGTDGQGDPGFSRKIRFKSGRLSSALRVRIQRVGGQSRDLEVHSSSRGPFML